MDGHVLHVLYRCTTGNGATVGRRPNRVWIFNCLRELPLFQKLRRDEDMRRGGGGVLS